MITEEQLLELGFKQVDPVWQARGHRFESGILHHTQTHCYYYKPQVNTGVFLFILFFELQDFYKVFYQF